jgi:DNA-binding transcriptional LysR family regulator
MSLQTAWLRSFLAVADKSGFGAATLVLHLSQSRVSAHIAALEHALGVSLFDRRARPVCMTEAGELFRGHALTALLELQSGIDAARSTLDNFVARVTIGSYPSVSSTYLPSVLRELKTKYPGVTVDLLEGTAASLEEMVVSGTVDLAFRPLFPKMRENTLCHRTIWREDIVAVMRDNDPLAKQASVSIDDMLSRPLIGNPAGSEEDGGGFDLRNTLAEAACRADIAYLTDQPATWSRWSARRSASASSTASRCRPPAPKGRPSGPSTLPRHTGRWPCTGRAGARTLASSRHFSPPSSGCCCHRESSRYPAKRQQTGCPDDQRTAGSRHAAPAGNENSASDSGLIRVEAPGTEGAW